MVKVQVDLSDRAILNVRLVKARYLLDNEGAINRMLEFVGSEF
jgi:hypothetical protein